MLFRDRRWARRGSAYRLLALSALALGGPLAAGCGGAEGPESATSPPPAVEPSPAEVESAPEERSPPPAERSQPGAESSAPEGSEVTVPAWVGERLLEGEGDDVALVLGTADFAVGENRVNFLVVRPDNELVQAPLADVLVAKDGATSPKGTRARLGPVGIPHSHSNGTASHDHVDATDLYVAQIKLDEPGVYWLVVEPRGESIQAAGLIEVREETLSPGVGTLAIPSATPTLDDAPVELLTTGDPPRIELLRYSVGETLEAGIPLVLTFATPSFCESRVCGPTVDVVDAVRGALDGSGVRFIHVEIFEENKPANGFNEWVREWNLPSEPWTFVVDGDGVIQAKFEGAVSVDELEAAVRKHLL